MAFWHGPLAEYYLAYTRWEPHLLELFKVLSQLPHVLSHDIVGACVIPKDSWFTHMQRRQLPTKGCGEALPNEKINK